MSSRADEIIALYERHAQHWDSVRGRAPTLEKVWLDRFLSLLPAEGTILDLGCGTGEPIARYFIEQGFDVTGVDGSTAMISLCRGRFPGRDWLVADMRTLSLGKRFRGLIAWDSFFHLPHEDQRRMFPIFQAHAEPGAALMFTSGPAHGEAIGAWQGEPLYHASLSAEEYRDLLDRNGFAVLAYVADDPDCGRHTVWLARMAR